MRPSEQDCSTLLWAAGSPPIALTDGVYLIAVFAHPREEANLSSRAGGSRCLFGQPQRPTFGLQCVHGGLQRLK